ncbi:hypothetical protein C448_07944 [Halococcus morrhuae DSM 1307]|uniref:UspA domain-containing protein n=1 Tax=Halococcus morrhuae DSM 1307 TaxID=931277 RepID=M0MGZ2_HALMO|nr:hypothetical protein C448_07944 [Halococcus morrhuae DSM 1307]
MVVEGTESTKELVREAGELAEGVGAELFLLHVTTEEQFSEYATSMADIPERNVGYGGKRAREGARLFAEDIGIEMFDGLDVEYEAIGALGDSALHVK